MQPHLDTAYWIGLLISLVLPVLVGLVTTRVVNASVKAVLLLALTGVTGFLTEFAAPHDAGYSVASAVILTVVSFGTAVLSHFGLWKPTGITVRAQDFGTKKSVDLAA
jgi:FtsH-binding integral membrane protein